MAEVVSGLTQGSKEKHGGAHEDVVRFGLLAETTWNCWAPASMGAGRGQKGTVLKAAFTLVFTSPRSQDFRKVLVLGSCILSPSLLQPLQ